MKIFLDSADIKEIASTKKIGLLEGITTNPSLIKKAMQIYKNKISVENYIKNILKVDRKIPVSIEVIGDTYEEMMKEGKNVFVRFKKYGNVYIKIPVNPCMEQECTTNADGIKAIKSLTQLKIPVNCTLIFTPEQALLAAKAGAKIVSPFLGREDDYIKEIKRKNDNGIVSGIDLLKKCIAIIRKNKLKTQVLAASIRTPQQFRNAALIGADIITLPYNLILKLLVHKKTMQGMQQFTKDTISEYKKLVRNEK
ncbi:MAG: transaldolase family protein [Nanoarchaeota archaeon]